MSVARRHVACLVLLAVTSSAKDQSRWSRQLSSYTADISDWVPLPGPVAQPGDNLYQNTPIKRQAIAEPRILAEPVQFPTFSRQGGFGPEPFPSRIQFQQPSNRQLYLQSVPAVPSAPQNYLSDQGFGQAIRFGLQPSNFPLSQGFVAPQLGFDGFQQINQRPPPPPTQPIKFESFPKSLPSQQVSPQAKPFYNNQAPHPAPKPQGLKPQGVKTVDGYQLENVNNTFAFPSMPKKKPVSLQKLKYEQPKIVEPIQTNKQKSEREEVQLLYVPVESLNRGQFNYKTPQGGNPQNPNNDFFNQNVPKPQQQQLAQQTFASDFQRPVTKTIDYNLGQDYYSGFNKQLKEFDQVPKFSTISSPFPTLPSNPTTPKPKKLKPHQPPLAVFLAQDSKKGEKVKVGDVLLTLKNAKTVAVLDSVSPGNAPKVFIGPSSLAPPENYAKFELPYLSNLQNSDRKLKQMPFFVAPLSYNTPDGFAKIPFPSPHVGSVIVNAQVKDTGYSTPAADVIPNSYTASPPTYRQEQSKPATKPTFSYYSTAAPKTNSPPANEYQSSYYSFEPQQVSTIKPKEREPSILTTPPKQGSYFIQNNDQYEPEQYMNYQKPNLDNYNQGPVRGFNIPKQTTVPRGEQQYTSRPQFVKFEAQDQANYNANTQEPIRGTKTKTTTTTPATTTHIRLTSTKQPTQSPSTYPSQLLETHNPYSINQAFHLSTPISDDYQNFYDEGYVTPGSSSQSPSPSPTPSTSVTPKAEIISTDKPKYQEQSSPNYLQKYSPEIHYESENTKYYNYNQNDYYTKPELSSEVNSPANTEYSTNIDTQTPEQHDRTAPETQRTLSELEQYYQSTSAPSVYNNYGSDVMEYKEPEPETTSTTTTTTTSTTTTRRPPLRARGRPRYTTTPRTESGETTRTVVTRRPLRERRPLPNRSRYEPNKITTEKPTRKSVEQESIEVTTKSTIARGRTRARGQYRPTESDESSYEKKGKKEADLAYQRDVLHQNYPVTLQERMSTVDIEAITEPVPKISSTRNQEPVTDIIDTEQAYSNEQAYSQYSGKGEKESNSPYAVSQSNSEYTTETPYAPRVPSTKAEEPIYHSGSDAASEQSISESNEKDDTSFYSKPTTPIRQPEIISIATEPSSPATEQPRYSVHYSSDDEEQITTTRPDLEITRIETSVQSSSSEREKTEEIVPQTTPSYRVRVRPGNRQYNHITTDSPNTQTLRTTKTDRRRPVQAVTYRPSFSQRRTTMRIEEIEADLKTKQVHVRPEQDYRHPVYKPEPTTEPSLTNEPTEPTKRGQFRRRRPSYSTTSTEAAVAKKGTYEVKSRFKGRRPTTEKVTTDKTEIQTDTSSTTRSIPYNRYTRPRLSERFNKKPVENEEVEDQESNYSINRPRYTVTEEGEHWSSKFPSDSFKPYNPNEIQDETKLATTERRSDKISELDIITARSDYDDILVSVTPASNRNNKKIPEIPPTLEALVEQSKGTESGDHMSTFETMLEEVMKSLEEQDENEYTTNVMKHKGGEIGEIPPETIISNEDNILKRTTVIESDVTTIEPSAVDDTSSPGNEQERDRKSRRRGFWKKVNVRPITESIEAAESQYYSSTVNRLGDSVKPSKLHEKTEKLDKDKVTTYKPSFHFIEEFFDDKEIANSPLVEDIPKINTKNVTESEVKEAKTTTVALHSVTETKNDDIEISTEQVNPNPGEQDLGTGSPDPTVMDLFYSPTTTEPGESVSVDRSDGFSFMDYLFGVTAPDTENSFSSDKYGIKTEVKKSEEVTERSKIEINTEGTSPVLFTTETSLIPDEITTVSDIEETTEHSQPTAAQSVNLNTTKASQTEEKPEEATTEKVLDLKAVETASVSSFMDPTNIISTSMSTEISHETEICFRGKCIKTSKDIL